MRNRQLIAAWCYEQGRAERVIDIEQHHGKHYVVVNDFQRLRTLFGKLLHEIQRIKSEGDYEAGQQLVERYGVRIDKALHEEVLARYAALRIEPYSGFVNPEYTPVVAHGEVVDIRISYPRDYVQQMLNYSEHYSFLPNRN
jgi:dipeptidyl-peptidase-3